MSKKERPEETPPVEEDIRIRKGAPVPKVDPAPPATPEDTTPQDTTPEDKKGD